MLFKSVVKVLL